jgi:hypothetical protein
MSLFSAFSLVVALFGAAPGTTEDADVWLERLATLWDRAPFSLDYEVTVRTGALGQALQIEGDAELLYGGRSRSVMNMSLSVLVPELEEPLEVVLVSVADGEVIWTEMQSPATGGLQVVKIPLAGIEQMAAEGGFAGMMGGATMDPMAQIEALKGLVDFAVADSEGELVTLHGAVREDRRPGLGAEAVALLDDGVKLVLDAQSGAPVRLRLGPDSSPHLDARFANLELLARDEVGADSFLYEPPDGVAVIEPLNRNVVAP